jgi:hypothetical protein
MDEFYSYNNRLNGRPFQVDMTPILERIPIQLTALADWAQAQDWTLRDDGPSGG